MAHGDAIIHRDGIEFFGNAACCLDFSGDQLAEVFEVNVAGHKLGEGVCDRNDRLAKVTIFHACRAPEATCASHITAMGAGSGTICGHGVSSCNEFEPHP